MTGLDALRGIAAFVVLFGHMHEYAPAIFPQIHSFLAVDFFFMLSGYVMARTYEDRFRDGNACWFIWHRWKRFAPTMAIGTLIGIPLLSVYPFEWRPEMIAFGLLLLPYYWGTNLFPINVVAWSIFFELIANGLHAAGLWKLRTRALAMVALASFVCLLPIVFSFGLLDIGATHASMSGGFPRVIASYVFGIILWRTMGEKPPFAVPAFLTLIALPAWCYATASPITDLLFVALVSPLLLVGGLNVSAPRAGLWLGEISFPLYALQIPILDLTRKFGGHWSIGMVLAVLCAATVALPRLLKHYSMNRMKPFLPVP